MNINSNKNITTWHITDIIFVSDHSTPWGVAVDYYGNVYIADTGNSLIQVVADGILHTIAGGIF